MKHSLHPAGPALDINPAATGMARACGLIHGEVGGWADAGHFQLGGWAGRTHGKRYAAPSPQALYEHAMINPIKIGWTIALLIVLGLAAYWLFPRWR